jgi:hypothetical protein
MPNAQKVSTGKPKVSGAVFRAPAGTTLPTDATTALAAAFAELGYVSEDGVTNSNTPESNEIKDWGGQTVLVVENSITDDFVFTLIESLNPNVLKARYGDSKVTESGANISITADGTTVPEAVYVIDMALRGGAMKRIVIPNGSIKSVGDVVYKADQAIGYPITLAAMPDSTGVNHKEYINLGST